MSFLLLCDKSDAVEEPGGRERREGVGVGHGVDGEQGEAGADWEDVGGWGQFSSDSSMWTMAVKEEGRRLDRGSEPSVG